MRVTRHVGGGKHGLYLALLETRLVVGHHHALNLACRQRRIGLVQHFDFVRFARVEPKGALLDVIAVNPFGAVQLFALFAHHDAVDQRKEHLASLFVFQSHQLRVVVGVSFG